MAFTCQCGAHVRVPFAVAARSAKAEVVEILRRTGSVMQTALNDQSQSCNRMWVELKRLFDEEDMLRGCRTLAPEAVRARTISRSAIVARDIGAVGEALDQWVSLQLPLSSSLQQLVTAIEREGTGELILRSLANALAAGDKERLRHWCNKAAVQGFGLPLQVGAALRALDTEERAVNDEREYQSILQARVLEAHARFDLDALSAIADEARLLGEDASVVEGVLSLHGCGRSGKPAAPSSGAEKHFGREFASARPEMSSNAEPECVDEFQFRSGTPRRAPSKDSVGNAGVSCKDADAPLPQSDCPTRSRRASRASSRERGPSPNLRNESTNAARGSVFRASATRSVGCESPRAASAEGRSRPFVAMARAVGRSLSRPASAGMERSTSAADHAEVQSVCTERCAHPGRTPAPPPDAVAPPSPSSTTAPGFIPSPVQNRDPEPMGASRPFVPRPPPGPSSRVPTPRVLGEGGSSSRAPSQASVGGGSAARAQSPTSASANSAAAIPSRAHFPAPGSTAAFPSAAARPPRPSSASSGGQPSRAPTFASWATNAASRRSASREAGAGGGLESQPPSRPNSASESCRQAYEPRRRAATPPPVRTNAPPRPPSQPPPSPSSASVTTMTRPSALACLGITCIGNPTLEDVRRAYKQAALKWHPDRQQNHACPEEAKNRFQEVRAAFEFLQAGLRAPAAAMGGA